MKIYSPFMEKYRLEEKKERQDIFFQKLIKGLDKVSVIFLFLLVSYFFVCVFMQFN